MAVTQQRLHGIDFLKLKNLIDLTVDLEPNNVTGIFGVNGSGKSTIIYSLLCLFKPTENMRQRVDFKFSQYFTHTSHTKYLGSNFKIVHSFRIETNSFNKVERIYTKGDRCLFLNSF